ncbi:MAG TPA: DUF2017 domain-containing protein [Streptosporangiaceae bacterium]
MTRGFHRARGKRVTAKLDADEAEILRVLAGQLIELISADAPEEDPDPLAAELGLSGLGMNGRTEAPDDPVLARLFPSAYTGDDEAAGEFRRFTEGGLRDGKRAAADLLITTVPDHGGSVTLTEEQGQQWLRALNDMRLALGTRLGVTEEAHEEIAGMRSDDPRYPGFAAYDWLSFLQDTLVQALY